MTHALNHPIPPTPPAERAPSATAVPRSAPPPPTPDDTWAVLVQLRQTTAVRGANKRHTARTSHFFRALDAILRKHEDVLGKYVREDHMDAIPFVLDRAASSGGGHSSTTTGGRDLYFRNKQHARLFIGFLKKFFVLQVKTPSIDKLNGTIPKNRLLKISVELCAYMKTDLCLLQDGSMVSKKKKMPDRTGVRGLCLIVGHWGNVMQFYDPKVGRCFVAPTSLCWPQRTTTLSLVPLLSKPELSKFVVMGVEDEVVLGSTGSWNKLAPSLKYASTFQCRNVKLAREDSAAVSTQGGEHENNNNKKQHRTLLLDVILARDLEQAAEPGERIVRGIFYLYEGESVRGLNPPEAGDPIFGYDLRTKISNELDELGNFPPVVLVQHFSLGDDSFGDGGKTNLGPSKVGPLLPQSVRLPTDAELAEEEMRSCIGTDFEEINEDVLTNVFSTSDKEDVAVLQDLEELEDEMQMLMEQEEDVVVQEVQADEGVVEGDVEGDPEGVVDAVSAREWDGVASRGQQEGGTGV